MSENEVNMHFVCTREEAKELIENQSDFWIANCGCREGNPNHCQQSRTDVCLWFEDGTESGFSGVRKATREEAFNLLTVAKDCKLVTRPFRSVTAKDGVGGICFCCQDCCGYFKVKDDSCDKGTMIEQTDMVSCSNCSLCTDVCYFDARKIENDQLTVDHFSCYGCGICEDVCPTGCIKMIKR
jgi:NAD-dependent dihydropyrimidine dehydrogenase PreA subunit